MTAHGDRTRIASPLSRARGAGSAQGGVHHWLHQRITAIANIPLILWLVGAVVHLAGRDFGSLSHAEFTAWLSMPINAVLMILAVVSIFYHAALGAQVIVEDYVHNEGLKFATLTGLKLFLFAAAITCIFSVLKIALA